MKPTLLQAIPWLWLDCEVYHAPSERIPNRSFFTKPCAQRGNAFPQVLSAPNLRGRRTPPPVGWFHLEAEKRHTAACFWPHKTYARGLP
jgi:hypothetical protein